MTSELSSTRWIWPMSRLDRCACGCNEPIPAGRQYFASDKCLQWFEEYQREVALMTADYEASRE